MSTPFGGTLPAVVPYSANCDKSGNATITVRPRAAFWWAGKAVTKVSAGSPVVEVTMGGIFGGFGRGQRSEVSGLMVPPGDTVTISVIGAQANAAVTGALQGTQGPTMPDVAGSYSPAPNTIALDTASPITVIGSIQTVGNGDTVSKTLPVPPGAVGIAFIAEVGSFAVPQTVIITGDVNGGQYVNATLSASSTGRWFPPDANAICSVTSNVGAALVNFLALSYSGIISVTQPPGSLAFRVNTSASYPLSARVDVNAVAADTQVIAGVAGQTINLGTAHFFSSAGTRLMLKDGNAGTVKYVIVYPAANLAPVVVPLNGLGLTAGNGLFVNTTAGNEIEFSTTYNQA